MIAGADTKVHDAFRATLRERPSTATLVLDADAADVLEVTDLARAIARAEEVMRARSSTSLVASTDSSGCVDIFEALVATDDTSGPALHAPYIPTPLPPPPLPPEPCVPALAPPSHLPAPVQGQLVPAERLFETSRARGARGWALAAAFSFALLALGLVVAATSLAGAAVEAPAVIPRASGALDPSSLAPATGALVSPVAHRAPEAPEKAEAQAVPVLDVSELKSVE